jgi:hypothetical protein
MISADMARHKRTAADAPHDTAVIHQFLQSTANREKITAISRRQTPFGRKTRPDGQRLRQLTNFGFYLLMFELGRFHEGMLG